MTDVEAVIKKAQDFAHQSGYTLTRLESADLEGGKWTVVLNPNLIVDVFYLEIKIDDETLKIVSFRKKQPEREVEISVG